MTWQDGAIIYLICMTGMLCALVWQANREILKLQVSKAIQLKVLGAIYRTTTTEMRIEMDKGLDSPLEAEDL